ncbi:MAG TPA: hypothetical protein VD973_09525 [Symbiobacteriaceae bacterium]|nr:hypothetical protein [Symbiobacteriaceae bacterium]
MADQKPRNVHELQTSAVGVLTAMSLETTKLKEGSTRPASQYLKAEISACGSKLRVTVFGSKKRPNLPQELNAQLAVGQKVSARGSLEEQVGQDQRLYRGLRAWAIGPAESYEEEKLVYHIAGNMGRLEKTGAGELVVPIICVESYEKDGAPVETEKTLRVSPSESDLKMLYEKLTVGRTIRARGDIIAKTNVDRFGLPVPGQEFISRLGVALLEVWDPQVETWRPLSTVTKAAGAPGQPTQAATNAPTSVPQAQPTPAVPQPTAVHDDDNVPF